MAGLEGLNLGDDVFLELSPGIRMRHQLFGLLMELGGGHLMLRQDNPSHFVHLLQVVGIPNRSQFQFNVQIYKLGIRGELAPLAPYGQKNQWQQS